MRGGEEGFEDASDSEQGNGSGEETDGFCAGKGERVAAAEDSGEEEAGARRRPAPPAMKMLGSSSAP